VKPATRVTSRAVTWMAPITFVALSAMMSTEAAALQYSEAEDGELGVPDQSIFDLDLGTNSFAGEVRFIAGLGIPVEDWQFDSDDFYFRLPTNSTIERVALSWTVALEPSTTFFRGAVIFVALIDDEDLTTLIFQTEHYHFATAKGDVLPFLSSLPPPAEADIFRLFMLGEAAVRAPHGEWAGGLVDYEWSILVSRRNVPEPDSAVLLMLGLTGLAVCHRRRSWRS